MSESKSITLSSGRTCALHAPPLPFVEHYRVLSLSPDQGRASSEDFTEMLLIATHAARTLGHLHYGDDACFSLVVSGARTRRRPWLHVHILPARNPAAKRLAFLAYCLKRVIPSRRRSP